MYWISAAGGSPEPILGGQHNEIDPTWSPNGDSLAFSYWPAFEPESSAIIAIYTVDVRTHAIEKVLGSDGLWSPRWSPDGRYISGSTTRADYQALVLFDFKAQRWTELVKDLNGFSNWSRDGQYIYILGPRKEPAVVRIDVRDHKVEDAASVRGLRLTGSTGGFWTGAALDNSPMVLRDIGTREIYALDWQAP
jgi:hypothetical protein